MKWLVDTQLPHQLATALKKRGQQAIHVSELPAGHLSTDEAIIAFAEKENAVVVTKDADFVASYQLKNVPKCLLYVTTGNIKNAELIFLFMRYLDLMSDEFKDGGLIEIDQNGVTVR